MFFDLEVLRSCGDLVFATVNKTLVLVIYNRYMKYLTKKPLTSQTKTQKYVGFHEIDLGTLNRSTIKY